MDHEKEARDADALEEAIALLERGNTEHAEAILERVVANAPHEYARDFMRGDTRCIRFWDDEEFMHFALREKARGPSQQIAWVKSAYPQAFYVLGYIAVERGALDEALKWLDAGLRLEPHPRLKLEKAHVLAAQGEIDEAVRLQEEVIALGAEVPASTRAQALRSLAVDLVERGRLEEAERHLHESLKLDPDNATAVGELAYVNALRRGATSVPRSSVAHAAKVPVRCGACDVVVARPTQVALVRGRVVYLCGRCMPAESA